MAAPESGEEGRRSRLFASVAFRLVLLLVVFVAVPVIIYQQFRTAEHETNQLLMRSVAAEGRLIGEGLRPVLEKFGENNAPSIDDALKRFGDARVHIKVLFRPRDVTEPNNIFHVASEPPVKGGYTAKERDELIKLGVFDRLATTCESGTAEAKRFVNPAGQVEIITSVQPIKLPAGCWIIVVSHAADKFLARSPGQPYWQAPEVRAAGIIYLAMAAIVITIFLSFWRDLNRLRERALSIRLARAPTGASFRDSAGTPEVRDVAMEFDRMVASLHRSSKLLRETAEENAHALKGPVAVIAQTLERLRRAVRPDDPDGRRAIDLIERSVAKLDGLVNAMREADEAAAAAIDPTREALDLSALLGGLLDAASAELGARGLVLERRLAAGIRVVCREDLVETVVDNLLNNAAGFSPEGGRITVTLAAEAGHAEIVVADEGPGVPADRLEQIFERGVSDRPTDGLGHDGAAHAGIGLWIVKRNVEAVGGSVRAENTGSGGLAVHVRLRLAENR